MVPARRIHYTGRIASQNINPFLVPQQPLLGRMGIPLSPRAKYEHSRLYLYPDGKFDAFRVCRKIFPRISLPTWSIIRLRALLRHYICKCISGFLVFQSAIISGFRRRLIVEFDVPSRLRCSHSDAKVSRSRYRCS